MQLLFSNWSKIWLLLINIYLLLKLNLFLGSGEVKEGKLVVVLPTPNSLFPPKFARAAVEMARVKILDHRILTGLTVVYAHYNLVCPVNTVVYKNMLLIPQSCYSHALIEDNGTIGYENEAITTGIFWTKSIDDEPSPRLTVLSTTSSGIHQVLGKIVMHFGWKNITVLHTIERTSDEVSDFSQFAKHHEWYMCTSIWRNFEVRLASIFGYNIETHTRVVYLDNPITANILVNDLRVAHSTIFFMCAPPDVLRTIMMKAHEYNFDSGNYVFFNFDLANNWRKLKQPWYMEDDTFERNEAARKAYEALMLITFKTPDTDEYKAFSRELKRRVHEQDYAVVQDDIEKVNYFLGSYYDAVLVYADAANRTVKAGFNISNGEEVSRAARNRSFQGITGHFYIDNFGHRHPDFELLDMNPISGNFRVVGSYFGINDTYEPDPTVSIHWAGGQYETPSDTPKCGFDNSKCVEPLKCYNCADRQSILNVNMSVCGDPFNVELGVLIKCKITQKFCQKRESGISGIYTFTSRSCEDKCNESTALLETISCCSKDLCNESPSVSQPVFHLWIASLTCFWYWHITK